MNELKGGRAQGVPRGSKGVLEVDVLMCPSTCTSMAAVHLVAAVTYMCMTFLRWVEVRNHAGHERIEGRQSSGGASGVKGCFGSERPHVPLNMHKYGSCASSCCCDLI